MPDIFTAPAAEGIAFLRFVCSYGYLFIILVLFLSDNLSVYLIGYRIIVDAEVSFDLYIFCRHLKPAGLAPAAKGISLLRWRISQRYIFSKFIGIYLSI